jgi:hypothetical protein
MLPPPISGGMAKWIGSGTATFDLYAPVAPSEGSPRLVLRAVGTDAPVVSLKKVVLYGCSKT